MASNPTTDFVAEANVQATFKQVIPEMAQGVSTVFPAFQLSDWLTERGTLSIGLMREVQGCASVSTELLSGFDNVKSGWNETWYAQQWNVLMGNGGRPFAGPLLVLIGTKDTNRPIVVMDAVVKQTCDKYPQSQLDYYIFEGSQHTPTLFAAQPLRSVGDYQQNANWFLEYALWEYELQ